MEMKKIKKSLLLGNIRITAHALQRMDKRGYTKKDIISCIWSGEVTKTQNFQGNLRAIVEGIDTDKLPIVLAIGRDFKNPKHLSLISVFPPIQKKFKRVI